MSRAKILLLACCCIGAIVVLPRISTACSCFYPTPEEAFEQCSAVFTGTVVAKTIVDPNGAPRVAAVFQWHASWKDDLNGAVVVFTAENEAICGYTFQVGETYLVYAYGSGPAYSTNLCTRTMPLFEGAVENEGLGEPKFVSVSRYTWGSVKALFR